MKKQVLGNGVTVLYEILPHVRSASVGIWVEAGSRHEPADMPGVCHFIEHMLFKGTKSRTSSMIAQQFDEIGGQVNAFTTKEYTCFYAKTLDIHLYRAVEILADMFLNSKLDEKDIELEKNVVLEEFAMYEDSPEDVVSDRFFEAVWDGSPLGLSVLGREDSVLSLSHDSILGFMQKSYTPDRVVISVAGSFDETELINRLERLFGRFSGKNETKAPETPVFKKSVALKAKDIEQNHIIVGFPALSAKDERIYALSVLNNVAGNGMSSRLFQKLREETGLAYSTYSFITAHKDAGVFCIYAAASPESEKQALDIMMDELAKLRRGGITKAELERTKNQILANLIMGLESSASYMSHMGKNQLVLGYVPQVDDIMAKVSAVTLGDVAEMIELCLNPSNMAVSVVGKPQSGGFYQKLGF